MSFSICITNAAKKQAKKLPKKVKEEVIRLCTDEIAIHPFNAEKLSPPLQMCRSHHFTIAGVSYRIAYIIVEQKQRIDVVLIGSRENLYKKLRQSLRK